MSIDPDFLLLDRVFQPAVDRVAAWATPFDLARLVLIAVIVLHTVVLASDLAVLADPLLLALVTGGTLVAYRAASQMRRQIARAERQSRPGMMNMQRVLLRPFRMAWLGLAAASAALAFASAVCPVDLCDVALSVCWLVTAYLVSCSPSPPARRTVRHFLLCPAMAG
ncbi:MAG: hypothetical protein JO157_15520 [Acetobacteraceae bacterium]|nr:hypothetical protein [Acetobacteraceae bacterium]